MPILSKRKLYTNVAAYASAAVAEDALMAPWITAIGGSGNITAPRRAIVNTLMAGLRTDGLLSILDRLWLLAAANTQQAGVDIINLGTWTGVNSPTFLGADLGYRGDNVGGSGMNTNFTPSTAGGHYTLNSASFGGYILNSRTSSNDWAMMGCNDGGAFSYFEPREGSSLIIGDCNGSSFINTTAPANAQGQFIISRTSSSQVSIYRNGNTTPIVSSSGDTSGALSAVPFYLFGVNPYGNYSTDTLGAAFIGGGLTSAQMALLAARINAYMTSLGINVY